MKILNNQEARKVFERNYKPVSDATWYRIKTVFNSEFPITEENLKFIAKLKVVNPGCNFLMLEAIAEIKRISKFKNRVFTGKEISDYFLYELKLVVDKSTISRWFKLAGGFNKHKTYTVCKIYPVFLSALIQMNRKRYEKAKLIA